MLELEDVLVDILSAPVEMWRRATALTEERYYQTALAKQYRYVSNASSQPVYGPHGSYPVWEIWDDAYKYLRDDMTYQRKRLALATIRAFTLRFLFDDRLFKTLVHPWEVGFDRFLPNE